MRKPPSKVCIQNLETVLDGIHFMGVGMGKYDIGSAGQLLLLFQGFRKVLKLKFEIYVFEEKV